MNKLRPFARLWLAQGPFQLEDDAAHQPHLREAAHPNIEILQGPPGVVLVEFGLAVPPIRLFLLSGSFFNPTCAKNAAVS